MFLYIYVCMCVCVYIYMYIYIYKLETNIPKRYCDTVDGEIIYGVIFIFQILKK